MINNRTQDAARGTLEKIKIRFKEHKKLEKATMGSFYMLGIGIFLSLDPALCTLN